jgi:hypothetical protein
MPRLRAVQAAIAMNGRPDLAGFILTPRFGERPLGFLPLGDQRLVLRQVEGGLLAGAGILARHALQSATQAGEFGQQSRQARRRWGAAIRPARLVWRTFDRRLRPRCKGLESDD